VRGAKLKSLVTASVHFNSILTEGIQVCNGKISPWNLQTFGVLDECAISFEICNTCRRKVQEMQIHGAPE
jgi:hypothetical protein